MRIVGAAMAVVAVVWTGTAAAESQERSPLLPADGVELFSYLLHAAGIVPATPDVPPSADTILIILGGASDRAREAEDRRIQEQIARTLRAGGAVLLASDRRGRVVLPGGMSVRVAGEVLVHPRAQNVHRGLTACPYVLPVGGGRMAVQDLERQLFAGLDRIATNRPSHLIVKAPEGFRSERPLAILPPGCLADGRPVPTPIVFAVGGRWSVISPDRELRPPEELESRLLVLADHSLFINQMLLEPDTHNLVLALRVIRYLQETSHRLSPRRRQCLLEYEGKVVESFDRLALLAEQASPNQWPPDLPPPLPPGSPSVLDLWQVQQRLTEAGNKLLVTLQKRDVLNAALIGPHHAPLVRRQRFEQVLAVLLTVAAIVALWRLRQQIRLLTDVNRRTPQRRRKTSDMTGSPSVHEMVQDLARQFFGNLGVRWDQAELPEIRVAATVAEPQRLQDGLRQLWQVARSRRKLSLQDWQQLRQTYQWLQQTHAEGKWQFAT